MNDFSVWQLVDWLVRGTIPVMLGFIGWIAHTVWTMNDRITKLETKSSSDAEWRADLKDWMQRLETKVDELRRGQ